jgi:hypothetical protein
MNMAKRICAWCQKDLGEVETASGQDSHGICPKCEKAVYMEMLSMETDEAKIARLKAKITEIEEGDKGDI